MNDGNHSRVMHLRSKARTKTFTGCWTCRLRHLKCDEARPQCSQCADKGVPCGGYSARLQWLKPNSECNTRTNSRPPKGDGQRRRLLPAANMLSLTEAQIERAISTIDRSRPAEHTHSRGPFSVFKVDPAVLERSPSDSPGSSNSPTDNAHDGTNYAVLEDLWGFPVDLALDDTQFFQPPVFDLDPLLTDPTALSPKETNREPQSISEAFHASYFPPISIDVPPSPPPTARAADGTETTQHPGNDPTPEDASIGLDSFLFRPTFMTLQIKHLLNHYRTTVMSIYTVLDNRNHPWSSFHLPRAYQCCTELEVTGSSLPARTALLYAILSVSAYNLQNRHLRQNQLEAARKWTEAASNYKSQALRHLQIAAADPLAASTSSGYKELLAAIMSMVTVDIVSGDTSSCGMYLNGCENLIRARRRTGAKESSKMKALHRIFFYLRVMQDAKPGQSYPPLEVSANDPGYETGNEEFEACSDSNDHPQEFDSSSWELVYGLPQSLMVLVWRTSKLLQRISRQAVTQKHAVGYPPPLSIASDQLENDILDWPVEQEIARLEQIEMSDGNHQIVRHHVRAWHQAIIVFFCRNVRSMHLRHLQQYVRAVIAHLESIEDVKDREGIDALPLLWPAFTAASNAIDAEIRSRFSRWFENTEKHGVGISKRAREALEDMWEHASTPDRARALVQLSPSHLTLT